MYVCIYIYGCSHEHMIMHKLMRQGQTQYTCPAPYTCAIYKLSVESKGGIYASAVIYESYIHILIHTLINMYICVNIYLHYFSLYFLRLLYVLTCIIGRHNYAPSYGKKSSYMLRISFPFRYIYDIQYAIFRTNLSV